MEEQENTIESREVGEVTEAHGMRWSISPAAKLAQISVGQTHQNYPVMLKGLVQ